MNPQGRSARKTRRRTTPSTPRGAGHGPRLAASLHEPLLARDGSSQRRRMTPPLTLEQLVDAGEAVLMELVKLTRMAGLS